jgi:hypothetical protein
MLRKKRNIFVDAIDYPDAIETAREISFSAQRIFAGREAQSMTRRRSLPN